MSCKKTGTFYFMFLPHQSPKQTAAQYISIFSTGSLSVSSFSLSLSLFLFSLFSPVSLRLHRNIALFLVYLVQKCIPLNMIVHAPVWVRRKRPTKFSSLSCKIFTSDLGLPKKQTMQPCMKTCYESTKEWKPSYGTSLF